MPQSGRGLLELEGVEVRSAAPTGPIRHVPKLRAWAYARRARRLMRDSDADVYHMHWLARGWLPRCILEGRRPLAVTVWGSDVVPRVAESSAEREAKREALARADLVCAASEFLRLRTLEYCEHDTRVEVVPFGVDLTRFHPSPRPVSEPVIGFVKHLLPQYGPGVLVEAMQTVARALPAARLVLVGRGASAPELRAQVAELGLQDRVEFRGWVPQDQLPELLRSFSVFAMPSLFESFGVAAVEAQATGIPVVASRVGGIPEVIADGETGLLVPPSNSRALADALVGLLADGELRKRLGRAARERAARKFDWRENVSRMEALYGELAVR